MGADVTGLEENIFKVKNMGKVWGRNVLHIRNPLAKIWNKANPIRCTVSTASHYNGQHTHTLCCSRGVVVDEVWEGYVRQEAGESLPEWVQGGSSRWPTGEGQELPLRHYRNVSDDKIARKWRSVWINELSGVHRPLSSSPLFFLLTALLCVVQHVAVQMIK